MAKQGAKTATPRLRFPEFRQTATWEMKPLSVLLDYERPDRYIVADTDYKESGIPVLTANKSFVLGYTNEVEGICTNTPVVIFDDFTTDKKYVDFPFKVKSSAIKILRAKRNDSLKLIFELMQGIRFEPKEHKRYYISEYQNLEIAIPEATEQQKIADCLTSLDEMIAAQGCKVEALKAHKRGLMQQLFPRQGETRPRLRFPEFRNAPEWEVARVCDLFETTSGGTPDRNINGYWGGDVPWVTTSLVDFNVITAAEEFISEAGLKHSSAKLFPKGTVVVAMYGQGKTRGKVALLGVDAATNQACAAILPSDDVEPEFVFFSLCGRYDELRSLSNSGGQENLSQGLIRELPFCYPKDKDEQQRIADCLASLDTRITAETVRLAALKTHKQGLMQQLFPAPEGMGA
jgi:type I restriction enzyme S subunit